MSQSWIAVDLDERLCLAGGGKLGDWFWSNPGTVLDALRIPSISEKIDTLLTGGFANQRASPLLRLPPELLDDILVLIHASAGAHDARLFLLALTCKALLAVAQRHIVRIQTQHHAPLAGHRLICIGDRATAPGHYPPGLFTSSETKTLLDSSAGKEPGVAATSGEGEGEGPSMCLYAHASTRWWQYAFRRPYFVGCVRLSVADLVHRPSAVSRMSKDDFARFQALTSPYYSSSAADGRRAWVLCNLSRGEYVRAEGVQDVAEGAAAFAYGAQRMTLWHMLLACICWSPSPVTDMAYEGEELGKGRWAGDRFSVTTLDSMTPLEEGKVWKDVTRDVVRLVKDLRLAEHDGL